MYKIGDLVNLLDHPDALEGHPKYGVVLTKNEETAPAILKVMVLGPALESYATTEDEIELVKVIK